MNKLKALGLALLAIGAISMIAASGAQANSEFHVTNWLQNVIVTGEQHAVQHVFTLTNSGYEIRCTTATVEGTPEQVHVNQGNFQVTITEITLTPHYTECQSQKGPFGAEPTVDMNGCKYTLTSTATALTATVDIVGCTANKKIQITTGEGCTIDVGEQSTMGGHITATNIEEEEGGVKRHAVTAHITLQGITYQITGAFCFLGQAQRTDGDYEGTEIFRAYEDLGAGAQETVNGHQYTTLKRGAKLQLIAT
jgi:hypothetical protein